MNLYGIGSMVDAPCGAAAWQPSLLEEIERHRPGFRRTPSACSRGAGPGASALPLAAGRKRVIKLHCLMQLSVAPLATPNACPSGRPRLQVPRPGHRARRRGRQPEALHARAGLDLHAARHHAAGERSPRPTCRDALQTAPCPAALTRTARPLCMDRRRRRQPTALQKAASEP